MNHHGHKGHHAPLPTEVNAAAARVLDAAFVVHTALGPGLLESVYEGCLAHALARRGAKLARQVPVPVTFEGLRLDTGLRLDLLVEDLLVVELKAVSEVVPLHRAQVLTYLKLTGLRLGLLLNFNVVHLRDGVQRIIR